jgi:hypothetical protein
MLGMHQDVVSIKTQENKRLMTAFPTTVSRTRREEEKSILEVATSTLIKTSLNIDFLSILLCANTNQLGRNKKGRLKAKGHVRDMKYGVGACKNNIALKICDSISTSSRNGVLIMLL